MTGDDPGADALVADAPIEVRQAVLEDLVAHAREEAPNECCGILVGKDGRIERSVRARNMFASPTRYQIDPRDQIAAIRGARARGESVLGFYHSHPASAPAPSATDRVEATYPDHCYLIVSPGGGSVRGEVRAFRLRESGNFTPLRLVPIP